MIHHPLPFQPLQSCPLGHLPFVANVVPCEDGSFDFETIPVNYNMNNNNHEINKAKIKTKVEQPELDIHECQVLERSVA